MASKAKSVSGIIIQAKYNVVKKRLHTCSPDEKENIKQLLDYYHTAIQRKRGTKL